MFECFSNRPDFSTIGNNKVLIYSLLYNITIIINDRISIILFNYGIPWAYWHNNIIYAVYRAVLQQNHSGGQLHAVW